METAILTDIAENSNWDACYLLINRHWLIDIYRIETGWNNCQLDTSFQSVMHRILHFESINLYRQTCNENNHVSNPTRAIKLDL